MRKYVDTSLENHFSPIKYILYRILTQCPFPPKQRAVCPSKYSKMPALSLEGILQLSSPKTTTQLVLVIRW